MIPSRAKLVLALAVACALGTGVRAQPARATVTNDQHASWVSAPAQPPSTPMGAQPPPYPIPVGYIGDIEFWAPNRGLLITAGNSVVPEGLYAYDGVSWHQLSTVCGGTDGRIAWAGPDEFWTIADQRPGQVTANNDPRFLWNVSLCHFSGGQFVASYAMPLAQADSWPKMNAAVCVSASDCWFGGAVEPVNGAFQGAFHLHWDGTNLSRLDGPQGLPIASMAVYRGQAYESVQLDPSPVTPYGPGYTPVLHVIAPNDSLNPFHSLFPLDANPACGHFCSPLPDYGAGSNVAMPPQALSGFALSSDSSTGAADPQLWAAAGVQVQVAGYPIVMLYADGAWTQVVGANPDPANPNLTLPGGEVVPSQQGLVTPVSQSIAAEPGEAAHAAWIVTGVPGDASPHVVRVQVSGLGIGGAITGKITDDVALGLAQGVPLPGGVTAISCPAAGDCWAGTQKGWLFHLTDGTQLPQDTDPNFAGVLTYRPSDGGTPAVIPPINLGQNLMPPPIQTAPHPKKPKPIKARPLVTHVHARLVHRTTLVLSFTLTATARVQLFGHLHGRIVARSARPVLRKGRHSLSLKLNPKRWPKRLTLKAVPAVTGKHGKT